MSVTTTSGIQAGYLTASQDPSVMALALEFMNADTANNALLSFLGNTNQISDTVKKTADALTALEQLLNQSPAPSSVVLSGSLAAQMEYLGITPPASPMSYSQALALGSQLENLQTDNVARLAQIKQGVANQLDVLRQFTSTANQLLEQFAPSHVQPPLRTIDHENTLDIVRRPPPNLDPTVLHVGPDAGETHEPK